MVLLEMSTYTYEYDAFGNSFTVSGTTPNEMMYRGEQYDSDLGLYYLRARYYNPLTGRFMSRDPNDPQLRDANGMPTDPKDLHKYLYAGGDPVNAVDPSGRDLIEEAWALGKEIAKVPSLRFIGYENALCIAGLGDTILGIANGTPPSPLGWTLLGIACGTAELHNILYIASLLISGGRAMRVVKILVASYFAFCAAMLFVGVFTGPWKDPRGEGSNLIYVVIRHIIPAILGVVSGIAFLVAARGRLTTKDSGKAWTISASVLSLLFTVGFPFFYIRHGASAFWGMQKTFGIPTALGIAGLVVFSLQRDHETGGPPLRPVARSRAVKLRS